MKRALVRANIALLVVLTSPVVALAANGDGETIVDWLNRLLTSACVWWYVF